MSNWPSDKDLDHVRKKLNSGVSSKLLAQDASSLDRLKFSLCEKFVIYKQLHNLNQRDLAKKVGIDEALISKVLHYHFDEFTVDRLVRYLSKIYPDMNLTVDVA